MSSFNFVASRYPRAPGCYLMKNAAGQVIYVGKTKVLRHRLASYFRKRGLHRRTRRLVAQIADIEVILVNNELESLVLENNLIKHYRPRFNRRLMDDKSGYFYIVLTAEAYPRLVAYRRRRLNKEVGEAGVAHRFGPYLSRAYRDTLLEYLVTTYGLRTCATLPRRACLQYHLHRCSGLCEGSVTPEAYRAAVDAAVAVLAQPHEALIDLLRSEMTAAAERLEFERAQRIKEQMTALTITLETQIVERHVEVDQAVLSWDDTSALLMRLQRGALLQLAYAPLDAAQDARPALVDLVSEMYQAAPVDELIVARKVRVLTAALRTTTAADVRVRRPRTKSERALLALAERNRCYRRQDAERAALAEPASRARLEVEWSPA